MQQQNTQSLIKKQVISQFPKTECEKLKKVIDGCIKNKTVSQYRFLIVKTSLWQIIHRKIVQKICSNYIPQYKLYLNCVDRQKIYWEDDFKQIKQALNILPYLRKINFYLQNNSLKHGNQLILIGDSLKQLRNLRYLQLDLGNNNLGQNAKSIKILGDSLKHLYRLEYLDLDLQNNGLGSCLDNLKYLRDLFRQLSSNLQGLELNLSYNDFQDNQQYFQCLGDGFRQMGNLRHFVLYLRNYFQEKSVGQFIQYIGEGILQLNELQHLGLYLYKYVLEEEKLKLQEQCLRSLKKLEYCYFD